MKLGKRGEGDFGRPIDWIFFLIVIAIVLLNVKIFIFAANGVVLFNTQNIKSEILIQTVYNQISHRDPITSRVYLGEIYFDDFTDEKLDDLLRNKYITNKFGTRVLLFSEEFPELQKEIFFNKDFYQQNELYANVGMNYFFINETKYVILHPDSLNKQKTIAAKIEIDVIYPKEIHGRLSNNREVYINPDLN